MRWLVVLLGLACCVVGDSGRPRRWQSPEVLPEAKPTGPSWLARVTELRTTLGRAGIGLEMRGAEPVIQSSGCGVSKRRCVRCELLSETDQVPGMALDEIVAAFDRYPTKLLDTSKIQHVALCRRLTHGGSGVEPEGVADPEARRLFVSVRSLLETRVGYATENLSETVHHEVFHLLDRASKDDAEWHGLNAAGFVYAEREDQWTRPFGFVNAYSATSSVEDRACVFQFLMARPDELCALAKDDPTVAKKAQLLWRRIAEVSDMAFLRDHVSCAAGIERGAEKRE